VRGGNPADRILWYDVVLLGPEGIEGTNDDIGTTGEGAGGAQEWNVGRWNDELIETCSLRHACSAATSLPADWP